MGVLTLCKGKPLRGKVYYVATTYTNDEVIIVWPHLHEVQLQLYNYA